MSQKTRTPTTFWQGVIKKAQMSVIFDRDYCTSSVHLHLQVTSLTLSRTTCSFHGNDSRRVGWLWKGECRQSDRSVEKTIPGQRRTLWTLAVIGCSLQCAAETHCFKRYLNVSVIFVKTAFYSWCMIDSICVPIVTLCLLYTFYVLLQYYVNN